ncbi:rhodanese-like domain-containing protein [Natrarchaeobius halalkaliphilus]|uniref:Rhodanese-like domain-containing protein n=1 Tax=Natrarchaeobius halalkaliphilus TaxID=1679091 RepID=A0A3N6LSA9_9EURY|nr:rhodanese-like domain-containing protein [Natrarchaeobius halalkaliphilus]RQG92788.1 rhodanese-like domain-containing protein [Natrarchaeobius halalkaliphilus]
MDGEVSPDEVNELLEANSDVRIVDIRDERSFERSHIPDSENVPFHELTARIDEFEDADRIVTVCPHGKASVQAAKLIGSYEGSADARVESMAGGLEEYGMRYGLVREDGDGDSTTEPESPF